MGTVPVMGTTHVVPVNNPVVLLHLFSMGVFVSVTPPTALNQTILS